MVLGPTELCPFFYVLAVLRAEAEEVDQIAAAMRALEGEDAGSSDGALEDDFVLAATTVRACASTCCCRCLLRHCCCSM